MNLETSLGYTPVFLSTSNLIEIKDLNFTNSNLGINNIITYPNSTNELQSPHVYVLKAVNSLNNDNISSNIEDKLNHKNFNAESFQIAIQNNSITNMHNSEQRFMLRPLKVTLDPNQVTQLSNLCKIETTSTNPVAFMAKVLSFPKSQSSDSNSITMTSAQMSSMEGKKLIPVIVPLSQTTNSDMVAMATASPLQFVPQTPKVRCTAIPILPKPQATPTHSSPPSCPTFTTNAQGMLISNNPILLGKPLAPKLLAAPAVYLNIRQPIAPSPTGLSGLSYKVIKPQPIHNARQQLPITTVASCQTETNRLLSEILVGGPGVPANPTPSSNNTPDPSARTARGLYYYGAPVRILPQPEEHARPVYIHSQGTTAQYQFQGQGAQSQNQQQQANLKVPLPAPNIGANNDLNSKVGNGSGGKKRCNCTKSQCLKLYCECFASGEFCQNCNCNNCSNNLQHEDDRRKAIKGILERNPLAFHPKIGKSRDGEVDRKHCKGCNCRRSGCLKNYCECYEAKIACSSKCKCVGCKNFEDSLERRSIAYLCGGAINSHAYFSGSPRPDADNLLFGNNDDDDPEGDHRNHGDYSSHSNAAGDIWRDFENSSLLAPPPQNPYPFDSPVADRVWNKIATGSSSAGMIDTLSAYLLSPSSLQHHGSQSSPNKLRASSRDCFNNLKDENSSQDVLSKEGPGSTTYNNDPFSPTSQTLPSLVVPSHIITDEIVEAIVTCMVAQAYEILLPPPHHQYKNGETTADLTHRYVDLERAVTREFGQCLTRIINVAKNSPFKANPTTPLLPPQAHHSRYKEDDRSLSSPSKNRQLANSAHKHKHPYGTRRNCASKYGSRNVDFEDGSRSTTTGHTLASGSSLVGSSSEFSLSSDMD